MKRGRMSLDEMDHGKLASATGTTKLIFDEMGFISPAGHTIAIFTFLIFVFSIIVIIIITTTNYYYYL